MSEITHVITEFNTEENRGEFRIENAGHTQAHMKFSRLEKILIIHHTEVKPFLRGKGAGKSLLNHAIADARERKLRIVPLCPYSRKILENDPSYADVFEQ